MTYNIELLNPKAYKILIGLEELGLIKLSKSTKASIEFKSIAEEIHTYLADDSELTNDEIVKMTKQARAELNNG